MWVVLPALATARLSAGHGVWTNLPSSAHLAITTYGLAFMNHYVKGEPADPVLTRVIPGAAQFRYASEIGNSIKDER